MASRLLRALCLLLPLAALPMSSLAAACIWFADATSIKRVDTDFDFVVAEAFLGTPPRRLVMNDNDCSVWALRESDKHLLNFDERGTLVGEVDVTALDPALTAALKIRLDPFDNSLWVTDGLHVSHFDAQATQLLGSFNAPAAIRRLRIGMDQKLWILGKRKLWQFNRGGALVKQRALDAVLVGEARHFVVDELRGSIWIAGDTQIARLDVAGEGTPTLVTQAPAPITAFALDPITGRIWYGQSQQLVALNPDGSPFTSVFVGGGEVPLVGPNRLAFDPASRSLWAGFDQAILRLTDVGDTVAMLFASDYDDETIGVPPFILKPRLALDRPPEGAIVNKLKPRFKLDYKARCNGHACDVPDSYFASLALSATLNGIAIGPKFVYQPATTSAIFEPVNPLPQGPSSFTARVTDVFGHKSNPIDTTITVDTIPPSFGTITPPAGSTVPGQVTLQGSVTEPSVTAFIGNLVLNPQGVNPQFPQAPGFGFAWGLNLLPGTNPIQISAIDAAGNVATREHPLIFPGGPLQTAIQFPANGAQITDATVTLTGTWAGPFNTGVTVNGVPAAISGYQWSVAVPLAPGANTIIATATAPDGTQSSTTIQVTRAGASSSPVQVSAAPTQGFAPLAVTFTVTSDRPIQTVSGDFSDGFQICAPACISPGAFFVSPFTGTLSFKYQQPGSYTARFNIVHADGTTATKTVAIFVQSTTQIDQQLRQIWSGMSAALIRSDKAAAMQFLTKQGQDKYGRVFDDLMTDMPLIMGSFSTPQSLTIDQNVGEYAVNRVVDGVNRIFFIYFIRDTDGVWRLDSM